MEFVADFQPFITCTTHLNFRKFYPYYLLRKYIATCYQILVVFFRASPWWTITMETVNHQWYILGNHQFCCSVVSISNYFDSQSSSSSSIVYSIKQVYTAQFMPRGSGFLLLFISPLWYSPFKKCPLVPFCGHLSSFLIPLLIIKIYESLWLL